MDKLTNTRKFRKDRLTGHIYTKTKEIIINDIITKEKNIFCDMTKKFNSLLIQKEKLEKKLSDHGYGNKEFSFVTDNELDSKRKNIGKIKHLINLKNLEIDAFYYGLYVQA